MKISRKVVLSFVRHLLVAVAAIGLAVWKTTKPHVLPWQYTKSEWLLIANALWLAVAPQLRFVILPLVKTYLKRKYPAAGVFLDQAFAVADKDLTAFAPTPPATDGAITVQIGLGGPTPISGPATAAAVAGAIESAALNPLNSGGL